ncbi:MAG: aldehyde dehydrogenase family protein [Solirubrobacterales bacterium]
MATVTAEHIVVRNPFTGEQVGTVEAMDASEVLQRIEQVAGYESSLGPEERAELLAAVANRLRAERTTFVDSIVAECGTAVKDARREVDRACRLLLTCAEEAKRLFGQTIPVPATGSPARMAITTLEPIGLVLAITPFNRPLNQVVVKLAPAIAANCPVVLKPSEKTPLTALRIAELFYQCGLPRPMLTVLTGAPDVVVTTAIESQHPKMITFTGSARIGKAIAQQAGMLKTTFELGDSSALLVLDDADLDDAVQATVEGAFSSSGQSCRGVKRVIVSEPVADEFIERLVGRVAELKVGDPADPETDIGALIDEEAAVEVERRIAEAVEHGAEMQCGGRRSGCQIWPTVLDRVSQESQLVAEETMGPCAPVIRVNDVEQAIAVANQTKYGLQAGVFTGRLDTALRCARELRTGTVVVNGGPQFDSPLIPFGGVKDSGLGREGAAFSMREMSVVKTVVL